VLGVLCTCRVYSDNLSKDSKQSFISWLVAITTLTLYTGKLHQCAWASPPDSCKGGQLQTGRHVNTLTDPTPPQYRTVPRRSRPECVPGPLQQPPRQHRVRYLLNWPCACSSKGSSESRGGSSGSSWSRSGSSGSIATSCFQGVIYPLLILQT
jgi:hypothetical protein